MKTQVNLFKKYKKEYWNKKTTKQRKGEILNSVEHLTGMHRKAIIRKFRKIQFTDTVAKKVLSPRLGRPRIYNDRDILALKKIWVTSDKVCGELLYPMINEYILQCKKYAEWTFSEEVEQKIKMMSERTVKRKVTEFYKKDKSTFRKGVSTTKPSSIKGLIPIKALVTD